MRNVVRDFNHHNAHTLKGVEWVKDDKDAKYLSLYQNMSLRNTLMPSQASKTTL